VAEMLVHYEGWKESPDFSEEPVPDLDQEEGRQWLEQDKEVIRLCQEESERLFTRITRNVYVVDGVFQSEQAMKDVVTFIEKVARIYQPDSEHPLLEVSIENIFRFLQRASLQFLVQLEQLPIDIKRYNLRETHAFVKKAMDYYGLYKTVSPYWDYARPVFFLGRFALGANPVTLGLSWTLTELASLGGRKISSHYTRRYGVRLFHESVRILGTEAAGVYGGDFRHRDPNWLYGVEVTELLSHFPESSKSLKKALSEISAIPMRSEYDRVYLYRCLARHESGRTAHDRIAPGLFPAEDRRAVVQRLEAFLEEFIQDADPETVAQWKQGVEDRIGIKLQVDAPPDTLSGKDERTGLLRSLAGFIIGVKEREPEALEALLQPTALMAGISPAGKAELVEDLLTDPPMMFDHPEVGPESPLLETYFADLCSLQVNLHPHEPVHDDLILEAGACFRLEDKVLREQLSAAYTDAIQEHLAPNTPVRKIDLWLARATLSRMEDGERPHFIHSDVSIKGPVLLPEEVSLWLVGTDRDRLLLIGLMPTRADPQILWQSQKGDSLHLRRVKNTLIHDCTIEGGRWNPEYATGNLQPTIQVHGRALTSYSKNFEALTTFARD
ncbi:MAG: hypothetical protein AAF514_22560, partial [Verrucomicrobiota bacterium]